MTEPASDELIAEMDHLSDYVLRTNSEPAGVWVTIAALIARIRQAEAENERLEANSNYNIREIRGLERELEEALAIIRQQEKRIKVMDEALAFYADEENHHDQIVILACGCCSDFVDPAVKQDNGRRARAARKEPT